MSIEQDTTSSKNQPASAASVEVPSNIQRQSLGQLLRGDLGFIPVLATFVAIVIYFQITTNGLFLLPVNISNLLQQIATTGIDALDRKSTRLNSSHANISYAVFCLK